MGLNQLSLKFEAILWCGFVARGTKAPQIGPYYVHPRCWSSWEVVWWAHTTCFERVPVVFSFFHVAFWGISRQRHRSATAASEIGLRHQHVPCIVNGWFKHVRQIHPRKNVDDAG